MGEVSDKPFKGRLEQWAVEEWYGNQYVTGLFRGHPDFGNSEDRGHTSPVVHIDARPGGMVETRNSLYKLGAKLEPAPDDSEGAE